MASKMQRAPGRGGHRAGSRDAVKVVVASRNPVKLEAARRAFQSVFPNRSPAVEAVPAESGVSDQPTSDAETRLGAHNRARAAIALRPDAGFGVGMEGGIERLDGELIAFAWMAVAAPGGALSDARSVTLPLPPAVRELIDQGLELGEANDRVFRTENSKQAGGAYGLLTNGRLTRESVYRDTLIVALTPFVNPLYSQALRD